MVLYALLKDRCPDIYVIDSNKDCLIIKQVILGSKMDTQWNWEWSRPLCRGRETNQFYAY